MILRYSPGFLIASLIQAGIIMATEAFGISTLGAKLTAVQLLTHLLVGQALGYILLFIMKKFENFQRANIWVIGITTGITAWIILLSLNAAMGKVNAPWGQGFPTVISSMIAFIAFGVIVTYAIKTYSYNKV